MYYTKRPLTFKYIFECYEKIYNKKGLEMSHFQYLKFLYMNKALSLQFKRLDILR